jgi:hypothetical protein
MRGPDGALLPTLFFRQPLSAPNSPDPATWCKTGVSVNTGSYRVKRCGMGVIEAAQGRRAGRLWVFVQG